jgi:F-type H+-transporting ATPase subunit delta
MAERLTIARPYAKAVFARARDGKRLAQWSEVLRIAAQICSDARVAQLFGNPHVTPSQLADFINGIGGNAFDAEARNLIELLASRHRLELVPYIAQLYEQMRADYERVLDVTVSSAVELSKEQTERFVAALRKRFARDVRLHTKIDSSLLGGAVVQADDLMIDGSVQGGLAQLATQIAR